MTYHYYTSNIWRWLEGNIGVHLDTNIFFFFTNILVTCDKDWPSQCKLVIQSAIINNTFAGIWWDSIPNAIKDDFHRNMLGLHVFNFVCLMFKSLLDYYALFFPFPRIYPIDFFMGSFLYGRKLFTPCVCLRYCSSPLSSLYFYLIFFI